MTDATKTILVLGDGSRLVSSPGGDLYWIVYPDGSTAPCPLQQASRYWMQYEESLRVGPNLPQESFDPSDQPTARPIVPQTGCSITNPIVQEYMNERNYSPWQRDLLQRLGLTDADVDFMGAARKKDKGKKQGD